MPSATELALYDAQTKRDLIHLANAPDRRNFIFGIAALIGGVLCFLAAIGGFVYLVIAGHWQAAGSLLGAAILTTVATVIRQRL